jgi:long-chain fatty acid transport protein
MTRAKRTITLVAFLAMLSSLALANGLNLNGLGGRAVAMGGAFVGLADDYTAIYWNPAGLAKIKKTAFGATGSLIMPNQSYKFTHPLLGITLVDAQAEKKIYPAGLAGFYFPATEKLTLGVGVYTPSGLGAKWNGADFTNVTNGTAYELLSFIGVVTISPVIAYEINDQISVGATLNINYGMFSISRWAGMGTIPMPPFPSFDMGQYEEDSTGWGMGATFGLLVEPSDMFSFGVTYRTASKVKMSGDASIEGFSTLMLNTKTEFEREVTSPMWFAAGIAIKPTEQLTFTADAQYTNWSKLDKLETEFKDQGWQAVMGATDGGTLHLNWEDKIQWRFGAEYKPSAFAIRAGYYFDPAPAPDETFTVLMPQFDYNVLTLGFGYTKNGFIADFAFEYLMGKDREVDPYPNALAPDNNPGLHTMNIISFEFGLGWGW